jgi:uncharacterized protein
VVNIASLLAFSGSLPPRPLPFRATYAYLVTFTCALAGELARAGVRVQVCCPGVVATEFHHGTGIDPARLPVTPMDADDVITASRQALELGETVRVPGSRPSPHRAIPRCRTPARPPGCGCGPGP